MANRKQAPKRRDVKAAKKPEPRLRIDVEWADLTKATGEFFVVGHYIGVLPQNAERALDFALSNLRPDTKDDSRLILTDLTQRGAIRGALGDVVFFPWPGRGHIVLAGMGRLGTFKEPQLRMLAGSVAHTIGRIVPNAQICMVLIGAGFGNLKIAESVEGLLSGVAQALKSYPDLKIRSLRIAEARIDRAYEILKSVQDIVPRLMRELKVPMEVASDVLERDGTGGVMPVPFGFSWMLAALAQASRAGKQSRLYSSLDQLMSELPVCLRPDVRDELNRLGNDPNPRRLGSLSFRVGTPNPRSSIQIPDRVSFHHDGNVVQSAAITNTTTVATRERDIRLAWIDRIVDDLHSPGLSEVNERGAEAWGRLVHPDLRSLMESSDPLVLELDRNMARISWELLLGGAADRMPLGIRRQVARQLRTAYSPRVGDTAMFRRTKVLIIGDPNDTLERAVAEAREIADLLKGRGLDVVLRIGSANELKRSEHEGAKPADLYEVTTDLESGAFDIVHFCGHGHFNIEYPDRSGWVFKDELLTPSKLEGVERPPRFIFANGCVTASLSSTVDGARRYGKTGQARSDGRRLGDSRGVAGLADEFFRRGVEDYIGTAWQVPENLAREFALKLYCELLDGASVGAAMKAARTALFEKREDIGDELGTVWAAYQHYGDPTRKVFDVKGGGNSPRRERAK